MQCMLEDIPAAAFQAIIRHITAADVANLRIISSAVCKLTTQHAPYVCLRLSPSSSPPYPEAWCQATQRLQHVQVVHTHITGIITLQVFEAALQSLSKHRQITVLHLLGVRSAHTSTSLTSVPLSVSYRGCIPSLQPIVPLKSTLKTLVITDLEMDNFASDLQQLSKEPAGTFQLQNLTVTAGWLCSKREGWLTVPKLCDALLLLAKLFPRLQQLSLRLPEVHGLWDGLHIAFPDLKAAYVPHKQLEATAIMTGIARAVSRLHHLQSLTITELPDPWAEQEIGPVAAARAAAAFTVGSMPTFSASTLCDNGGISRLQVDLLHSMPFASAAGALCTMDNAGCWLMQQQLKLKHLHLGCDSQGDRWSMTWNSKQQQPEQLSCGLTNVALDDTAANPATAASVTAAAELVAIGAHYYCDVEEPSDPADCSSILLDDFTRHLSRYSCRPADTLLGLITCCKLELCNDHVEDNRLKVLLQSVSSLTGLEIWLSTWEPGVNTPMAAITTAAAAVSGLKCLKLQLNQARLLYVTDNLLLPLTAAAGGPRGLQKLHMAASFAPYGSYNYDAGWLVLRQLTCLRDLSIEHLRPQSNRKVEFPVDSLPASVEVFRGQRLLLTISALAEQLAGYSGNPALELAESYCPELRVLHIEHCHMDPNRGLHRLCSMLASDKLEGLVLDEDFLLGGWSVAAAAWPAVKQLECSLVRATFRDRDGNPIRLPNNSVFTGSVQVARSFKDVCSTQRGFPALQSLMVKALPHLTSDMSLLLVQQLKQLRHVSAVMPKPCQGDDYFAGVDFGVADNKDSSVRSDVVKQQKFLQQQLPWATVELGPQRRCHPWEGY